MVPSGGTRWGDSGILWRSQPGVGAQFHCLSGCQATGELSSSQVRQSWPWDSRFPFLTADNAKACRLPWKLCFHLCLLNNHLLSLSPSRLGCPCWIKWSRKRYTALIPALIDCFPMIDVYPCTSFSESERGGGMIKSHQNGEASRAQDPWVPRTSVL